MRNIDTSLAKDFFFNGYVQQSFEQNQSLDRLLAVLRNLQHTIKNGFEWIQKYPKSFDLSPHTHQYDDIFLDFVFEQNLPEIVRNISGFGDLVLGDIALRRVFPGATYTGWHRDTHHYKGHELAGRTPPIHKIIYYPKLDAPISKQLNIIPGSQIFMSRKRIFDRMQTLTSPSKYISSSDTEYIFFNSFMLHKVPRNETPSGSFRLIFNFCHRHQVSLFKGKSELHSLFLKREELQQIRTRELKSVDCHPNEI